MLRNRRLLALLLSLAITLTYMPAAAYADNLPGEPAGDIAADVTAESGDAASPSGAEESMPENDEAAAAEVQDSQIQADDSAEEDIKEQGVDGSKPAKAAAEPENAESNSTEMDAADAEAENSDADAETAEYGSVTPEDPYMQLKMAALKENNALILPEGMENVNFSTPKDSGGLLLTGTVGELTSGRIGLAADLDFDRGPVGRISVDGLADRGCKVIVRLYIDDEEEPAAEFMLRSQMGKKAWGNPGDHTADIYSRKLTGRHSISMELEIPGMKASKKTSVLLRSVEMSESSLPVMYFNIDESQGSIDAMNGSYDHSVECYGKVDIQIPDGYVGEYSGKEEKSVSLDLEYIRGRGNSTWSADKKPYKFKLSKKKDLFGMGENKHWILLANRYDNSLVRNRMTYWLGAQLGMDYTPQCVPVDLVMNDTYYGSYLLCEQIRIGSSRVDIDDLDDNEESQRSTDIPFITGGYLLSMDYDVSDKEHWFKTSEGVNMFIESPSFEEYYNSAQRNYIKGFVQATENAIFGSGFKDENGKSYAEYLDTDAAVDYWWIQEFSANGDAYGSGSTYLYKTRDKDEKGKLFWGPLWDFDYVAWGDLEYENEAPSGFDNTSMLWFNRLRSDKAFLDKLTARWSEINRLLEEITKEGGLLDSYYDELLISRKYDQEKWGSYGEDWGEEQSEAQKEYTYREEIEQLRTWIEQRRSWVNENLSELSPKFYKVTFKAGGKVISRIEVREGESIESLPEAPAKKGYFVRCWEDAEKNPVYEYTQVFSDMVLTPVYVDKRKAVPARDIFFGKYTAYAPIYGDSDDEALFVPSYTIMPEDADDTAVTWKSSNPDTAAVKSDGTVVLKKTGKVRITGTLGSGRSASYDLIIYNMDDREEVEYIESLDVNKNTVRLREGGYSQVIATVEPQPYLGYLTWISMDESIATVDSNGVITANSPGTTNVLVIDTSTEMYEIVKVIVTGSSGKKKSKTTLKAPAKPVTVVSTAKKTAEMSWKKTAGAVSYKAAYRKAGAKKWKTVRTKSLKHTFRKLKSGTLYEFRVGAVGKNGKVKWSSVSRRYTRRIKAKVRAGKKKVTVRWKKAKKASGYQIQYSYKKNMVGAKKIIVKGKKAKYTIKNLKKGKKVYIQVRPVRKYKGKTYYGSLTGKKAVRVK